MAEETGNNSERRSWPIEAWSDEDQKAFISCIEADELSEYYRSDLKVLKPSTCRRLTMAVEGFMLTVQEVAPDMLKVPFAQRFTPALVKEHVKRLQTRFTRWTTDRKEDHLKERLADRTILVIMIALKMAAVRVAPPGTNFIWFARLISRLPRRWRTLPAENYTLETVWTIANNAIVAGRDAIIRQRQGPAPTRRGSVPKGAYAFRDGVMLAVLCFRPMRSHELLALEIGSSFVPRTSEGTRHQIFIQSSQNKVGLEGRYEIPDILTPLLDEWLDAIRPLFPKRDKGLWPTDRSSAIGYNALYKNLTTLVEASTDEHFSPRRIRHIIARFLDDLEAKQEMISATLFHINLDTAPGHYFKPRLKIDRGSIAKRRGL